MAQQQSDPLPPGWVGGFAQSNPKFAYPTPLDPGRPVPPDLSSLPFLDNMANIDKLERQQKVLWPEFSWETVLDDPKSRCFQMFAPDISRIGYDDTGRVYSIICPQQGIYHDLWGTLNIEVTVTGNRGWVDERAPKDQNVAADLTTQGQIWFSAAADQDWEAGLLWSLFTNIGLPFPYSKEHSIKVLLRNSRNWLPFLYGRSGESTRFESPEFARHWKIENPLGIAQKSAWAVANLEVMIGNIWLTGNEIVNEFNKLVMYAFNLASGNLLTPGNILTWNVWVEEPTLVNQKEWRDHAEKWRKSIDAGHGSPGGEGTKPRYFDGSYFNPDEAALIQAIKDIIAYLEKL